MRTALIPLFFRTMLIVGLLSLRLPVTAHEPGMSTAMVSIDEGTAVAVLTFSKEEVEAMIVTPGTGADADIDGLAHKVMKLSGQAPASARTDLSGDGDVVFSLNYTGLPQGPLKIEAPMLASFVPGHRQYLLVRDQRKHLLLRCFLTPGESVVSVEKNPD